MQLRPYQTGAIERVRGAIRQGRRRPCLVAPTGAGKTVIASSMMRSAYERGSRVLFVAHRRELIVQAWTKLQDAGIPVAALGILMADDQRANPDAPIRVASVDTLRHRTYPPADLVIIDECHRSLARTYRDLVEHYTGAIIVGLTATPYRADGSGLGDVFDALEVVTTPRQLIGEGFLVEPKVFSAPPESMPDLSGVRTRAGDYVEADLSAAVMSGQLVGGIVEHWQRLADHRRTVAFAVNVAHSEAIAAAFREAGVAAEHLDGTTPTRERDAILARLESGETRVVSNCGVLCEGWDQPAVKVAILARPTQSTGLYLQQAGRILRPWQDVPALILDHAGNCLAHGLPQQDREFSLEGTKGKGGGGAAPTKECRECHAVVAAGCKTCPECGEDFPAGEGKPAPEESTGELRELTPEMYERWAAAWADMVADWTATNGQRVADGMRPRKPGYIFHRFKERFGHPPPRGKAFALPPEIADAETKAEALRELQSEARARGYKPGWAVHRYRARFGEDPPRERRKRPATRAGAAMGAA